MTEHSGELGAIAKRWFEVMRSCGGDIRELLHDGHPTACVDGAAFAYVNAFKAHVNVGFFRGAEIADPKGLLEGTGRFMRHVKLRPAEDVDASALRWLIHTAYADIKRRLEAKADGVAQQADAADGASRRPRAGNGVWRASASCSPFGKHRRRS